MRNTRRTIAGVGRVVLWNGGSLWIGRDAGKGQPHAHHAIQISLALTDSLHLYNDATSTWAEYSGAIVHPHQRHQFDGDGKAVAHIFVEPETVQGRFLLQHYATNAITTLPAGITERMIAALRHAFAEKVANAQLIATGRQSLELLCGKENLPSAIDPRIARAIEFARASLGSRVTLAAAANVCHLSPSRFRHLFMEQTGISFRGYLLWARVGAAISEAMGGAPWTAAAQNWGFADSAHLSRTCRRMFGIAPSTLLRE